MRTLIHTPLVNWAPINSYVYVAHQKVGFRAEGLSPSRVLCSSSGSHVKKTPITNKPTKQFKTMSVWRLVKTRKSTCVNNLLSICRGYMLSVWVGVPAQLLTFHHFPFLVSSSAVCSLRLWRMTPIYPISTWPWTTNLFTPPGAYFTVLAAKVIEPLFLRLIVYATVPSLFNPTPLDLFCVDYKQPKGPFEMFACRGGSVFKI